MPSGSRPSAASSRAPGRKSTVAVSTVTATPLPWAISDRCPRKPKPVTSVQAWTRKRTITSRADLFSVVISRWAAARDSGGQSSALAAVVTTPMPSGFVRNRTSPGFAPALVRIRSGWTKPVTARPYLGSGSKMLWPPVIRAPAS